MVVLYFTNIKQKELKRFHEVIKNNFNTLLKDVKNNPLFKVEVIGDLLKIYPLFYTDHIESSNNNDRVMDNKCIICEDKNDTLLFFITEDNNVLNLDYSYYGDFINYIVFYVYDSRTGDCLHNIPVHAVFYEDDVNVNDLELSTDKRGIIYLDTSKFTYNKLEIRFNETIVFNWEENDNV